MYLSYMGRVKQIIREEINKFLNEDDIDWSLYELKDEILREVIGGFLDAREKGGGKQPWSVIPFPRLKKIWEDHIKYGFVRDTKGMDMFENIFTRNILKLYANTELAGHTQSDMADELNDYDQTMDSIWDRTGNYNFGDYIVGSNGQYRISDYGLEPLGNLLAQLRKEQDYEKKLPIMDKMLNVVHQRSDIAEMFIEGGSNSLNKLSGYYTPEEPDKTYSDDVSSISGKYKMSDYSE
jgi:hypothetical protein